MKLSKTQPQQNSTTELHDEVAAQNDGSTTDADDASDADNADNTP